MRVSAKVDYALRAMLELAAAGGLVKGERIATAQAIPQKFLENILLDLRHAELVASQRGVEGGYCARPAGAEISVADVIRAVEGPLATVRGARPEEIEYAGAPTALRRLWIELRAAMRGVLEETTLADLVARSATPARRHTTTATEPSRPQDPLGAAAPSCATDMEARARPAATRRGVRRILAAGSREDPLAGGSHPDDLAALELELLEAAPA